MDTSIEIAVKCGYIKDKKIIKTGDSSLSNIIETTGFTNL